MPDHRSALFDARDFHSLGHAAHKAGLIAALRRPASSVLIGTPPGKLWRDLERFAARAGGQDLATLLAFGDAKLPKAPALRKKLLSYVKSALILALDEPPGAAPPMTETELRAWARDKHVSAYLEDRVRAALQLRVPRLFAGRVDAELEYGSIEALLTKIVGRGLPSERLAAIREAAWAYLEDASEEATRGRAEEAAAGLVDRVRGLKVSAPMAALIEELCAFRAQLRTELEPAPADRRRGWELMVDLTQAGFSAHYMEEGRRFFSSYGAKLIFDATKPEDQRLVINEDAHSLAGERSGLSLLDTLLRRLVDPTHKLLRELEAHLSRPPWERALDELLSQTPTPDDPPPPTSWMVSLRGGRLKVEPRRPGKRATKRVPISTLRQERSRLPPEDRRLLQLVSLSPADDSGLEELILDALKRHPRVITPGGDPLSVQEGQIELCIQEDEDETLRLAPSVHGSTEALKLSRRGRGYKDQLLELRGDTLWVYPSPEARRDALKRLEEVPIRVPKAERAQLLPYLNRLGGLFEISGGEALPLPELELQPEVSLLLSLEAEALSVILAIRARPELPPGPPAERPRVEIVNGPEGEPGKLRRDPKAEQAALDQAMVALELPEGHSFLALPDEALSLLARLRERPDLEVEWTSKPIRVKSLMDERLRLSIAQDRDWFDVEGTLGEQPLDAVFLALSRGQRFIAGPDGSWLELEGHLLKELSRLEPLLYKRRGKLALSPVAAPTIEALVEGGAELKAPPAWGQAYARMKAVEQAPPPLPEGLQAELRPYQLEGFQWMMRLAAWGVGGCLADDMGLGKTLQALAVLLSRRALGPALVVAPTSVTFNWAREAARFTPGLNILSYQGKEREALLSALQPGDVLLTSYGLLRRDAEALAAAKFSTAVFDEAQALKNPGAQQSKAARGLSAEWRLALSGTPMENQLSELWSLMELLNPGLLGPFKRFRERFILPIERDKSEVHTAQLATLIQPLLLRRDKSEVASQLPPKTELVLDVSLSRGERAVYDGERSRAVKQLHQQLEAAPGQARVHALAALTRLRQIACNARLVDPNSSLKSSKMERFSLLCEELVQNGSRALVFSQFTRHLDLAAEALDKAGYAWHRLDGSTPAKERARRVDAFMSGTRPFFLISLKAGGTGLNLTAADQVIHLDPWWNPAVEDQATDRAHRIGQRRPVTVYRLVSRETVEEKILALHAEKRALVEELLSGRDPRGLSAAELFSLLSEGLGQP